MVLVMLYHFVHDGLLFSNDGVEFQLRAASAACRLLVALPHSHPSREMPMQSSSAPVALTALWTSKGRHGQLCPQRFEGIVQCLRGSDLQDAQRKVFRAAFPPHDYLLSLIEKRTVPRFVNEVVADGLLWGVGIAHRRCFVVR